MSDAPLYKSPPLGTSSALRIEKSTFLNTLLNTMVDGVIVINDRGVIQSLNKAAEKLFRYEEHEVINKNIKMLMPHKYAAVHDSNISNYLATSEAKIIGIGREVQALRKDGTVFPMDLSVSELPVREGLFFAGIIRDISDRKKVEMELHETLQTLEERVEERTLELKKELRVRLSAEKFALERQTELAHVLRVNTLWELGTTFAHELNQPLTVIMTYLQGLMTKNDLEFLEKKELATDLERILKHAQLASKIVNRFREYVKGKTSDWAPFDIINTINETLNLLSQELIKVGIKVDVVGSDGQLNLMGDTVQIQQVLVNLIKNSIDALEEKGDLNPNKDIAIALNQTATTIQISVIDNGIGFSECDGDFDNANFAFKAFYTTKRTGLGMGLAISQSIIEAHAGKIWMDEEFKNGAKVNILLPRNLPANSDKTQRDGNVSTFPKL
ncbi:MAG: PAS domain S-box protein [Sneathiella sp.]|nr:PAS domain S-box protein [Sneathiella sp.]